MLLHDTIQKIKYNWKVGNEVLSEGTLHAVAEAPVHVYGNFIVRPIIDGLFQWLLTMDEGFLYSEKYQVLKLIRIVLEPDIIH